jgi:5-aminolevulinate synthase
MKMPATAMRPRITPSLYHDDALSDALAEARVDVWPRVGLAPKHSAAAAE